MCWMCSCCMNLANASDENGGPLSVESLLQGPYWEISDLNFKCYWFCCLRRYFVEEWTLTEGVSNEELF